MTSAPILELHGLKKHFTVRKGIFGEKSTVKAVDGVSLSVLPKESFAIVGESGCGKTTLARTVTRLLEPSGGSVRFQGQDITEMTQRKLRPVRRQMQMVFQDPFSSLNPRRRVCEIVGGPLRMHGASASEADERSREMLELVGLSGDHMNRYPHEFSGGMRQRIGIARALALSPRLIVLDEPVSALDVSIQAQIINLLDGIQDELGLSYLFVAHDLSVVEHVSDRVAVMYLGRIVELAPTTDLFYQPLHPYTEALMSAIPALDPDEVMKPVILEGEIPSPANPPTGCHFHPRCPYAQDICRHEAPEWQEHHPGRFAACHFADTLSLKGATKA